VTTPEIKLRPAGRAGALAAVEDLLERSSLPTADVWANPDCVYVGRAGELRVGVVGLEPRGDAGLLRSLAVEPRFRGEGYGTALCEGIEQRARSMDLTRLYLLTTTAEPFFADRGYRVVDRSAAPAAIRRTREFEQLCPDAATCMHKPL